MAGAMSKSAARRATKSARACYSQVINVRFQPAALPRSMAGGERVTSNGPIIYPLPTERLRNAALRLAAELDDFDLCRAAAYASMVADAIEGDQDKAFEAQNLRTDVNLRFELDEHGRVWMNRDGDYHIIGRKDAVCAEMRRFLRLSVLGEAR